VVERPAINTSPLIFLTKGSFLNLLQVVSQEIVVPEAVATEIQLFRQEPNAELSRVSVRGMAV
jgi:predicted nucleic acid-binding protein